MFAPTQKFHGNARSDVKYLLWVFLVHVCD